MSENKTDQAEEAEVKVTEEGDQDASETEAIESKAESAEAEVAETETTEDSADESNETKAEANSDVSDEAQSENSSESELTITAKADVKENQAEAKTEATSEVASSATTVVASEEFVWPSDPEHMNAAQLLSERVEGVDLINEDREIEQPSYALNLTLLILVLGVGGFGVNMLRDLSSADRDAREKEKAFCRVEHNDHVQLLAEKQYGALRIETTPKSAVVERSVNGAPFEVLRGKTAAGEEIDALTPTTASNLDINQSYKFRLTFTDVLKRFKEDEEAEKKDKKKDKKKDDQAAEGEKKEREIEELKVAYRTEEFYVARYQWIQDGATGAFRTQKVISLVPSDVEHYYSFDWKSGKDMTFPTLAECESFVNSSDATLCRAIPALKNWDTEDARREEEAKKNTKRGRGRR